MSKSRKILLISLAVVVLGFALWSWFALGFNYSDGSRVGHVRKISNKGFVFKTWEGELDLTNFARADGDTGIWKFTVESDQVAHEIENLQGGKIKLMYHEKMYQFSFRGETKYIVYQAEKAV